MIIITIRSSGKLRIRAVTHSRCSGPRSPLPHNDQARSKQEGLRRCIRCGKHVQLAPIVVATLRKPTTNEAKRSQLVFEATVEIGIHI